MMDFINCHCFSSDTFVMLTVDQQLSAVMAQLNKISRITMFVQ